MATKPSYSYGGFEHRRFEFMVPSDDIMPLDELSKVKKELELLKLSVCQFDRIYALVMAVTALLTRSSPVGSVQCRGDEPRDPDRETEGR